jgi:hypothetical protein
MVPPVFDPAPAPAPAPVPVASTPVPEYTSNPFSLLIKSLGQLLELNGAQGLLLALRIVLVAAGIGLLSVVLALLHIGLVAGILFFALYVYVILAFTTSIAVIGGNTAGGKAVSSKEMFSQVNRHLLPILGLSILTGLAVAGGMILLIIPGLIFGAWFSLAPYILINEDLGVIASMKRSKELTSGHVFEIWGMIIASGILSGYGLLSFLVAPAAMEGRYRQLKELKAANAPKPAVHWSNYLLTFGVLLLFVPYVLIVFFLAIHGVQNNAKTQQLNSSTNNYYYTTPSQ